MKLPRALVRRLVPRHLEAAAVALNDGSPIYLGFLLSRNQEPAERGGEDIDGDAIPWAAGTSADAVEAELLHAFPRGGGAAIVVVRLARGQPEPTLETWSGSFLKLG